MPSCFTFALMTTVCCVPDANVDSEALVKTTLTDMIYMIRGMYNSLLDDTEYLREKELTNVVQTARMGFEKLAEYMEYKSPKTKIQRGTFNKQWSVFVNLYPETLKLFAAYDDMVLHVEFDRMMDGLPTTMYRESPAVLESRRRKFLVIFMHMNVSVAHNYNSSTGAQLEKAGESSSTAAKPFLTVRTTPCCVFAERL